MVIRVEGTDGTVAWVNAEDVRAILPAKSKKPDLPTEQNGVTIVGRTAPEIKASLVLWNTPGADPLVIGEAPGDFAQRVNAALRAGFGPTYDIPAVPLSGGEPKITGNTS